MELNNIKYENETSNINQELIVSTNNIETNEKLYINKFNNKLNILKNLNIQKCITWCNKHNLPVNKVFL